MSDIVFHNTTFALFTDVRHGQERLKGKLDSGAPITVFNLAALSIYLGSDEGAIRRQIKKSHTPRQVFKGYNGIGSDIYLCRVHNIVIDKYCFEEFFIGASMDYPIGKDGRPVTKILLGMDIVNSCTGVITESGDAEFNVRDAGEQRKRMLDAFACRKTEDILVVDEMI